MQDSSRRAVLRSIGTTLSIGALASVPAAATDAPRSTVLDRTWRDAAEFGELFEYVPASASDDQFAFGAIDYAAMREANRQATTSVPVAGLEIETDALSKGVVLQNGQYGGSVELLVLTGDVSLDGEGETVEGPTGTEYERYERDENVVAAVDDRLVVAASDDLLTDALAAKAGERDRLLDANEGVSDGIDAFGDADTRAVMVGDEIGYGQAFDVELRFSGYATTVRDPDTLERTFLFGLEDESDTEQLADSLEEDGFFGDGEDTTVETDGAVVTVTTVIDLAARRRAREHDSPGGLRVDREDLQSDDEYVTVEVTDGDPTPVDELTLEVGGETYDRAVWAGDQETIAGGDTIRFRAADVEPNLEVTITHEREYGTSSSTTHVLGSLEFDFGYAFDDRRLDVEYADTFDIDGDELSVVVFEGQQWWRHDADDETRTESPWTDETVTEGDTASLADVDPGETVVVTYGGTEPQDGIAYFRPDPPGEATVEYDFEARSMTVTLDLSEPRPAAEYSVLVDDEPVESGWNDTVETGDSVTVDDVAVGTTVAVVWGENDAVIASERAVPEIELELDVGDEIELRHAGGDAVPAEELAVHVWNGDRTVVPLADAVDGAFESGDTVALDVETVEYVSLMYDDRYYVGYASARSR